MLSEKSESDLLCVSALAPPSRFDLHKKTYERKLISYTGGRVQESSLKSRGETKIDTHCKKVKYMSKKGGY